jgi:hypothetical protein
MRIVGLALAGVLATTIPMTGYAAGPGLNMQLTRQEPSSNIVLVWDDGGSGGQARAIGSRPLAGRGQRNGHGGFAHWRQNLSVRWVGFLRRAASADLLGLGSWECRLRLSVC